ncbi:bacteriocin-protection protein [Vandammella animalimorsus]|uniref:Bacteriocin-protection protein n=1 Tax=Vandammella animalimorsus TaxID=2029117 RepID=A0A2A2AQQ0_9BURK|nr:YdeI/OmpD-associated family protein [Vandammella animalimorsus]PAT40024.1 bacteriocin-protection protein [Vandammella animalimorsus]
MTPAPPAELAEALAANPKAHALFQALPPSHQREYSRWIGEAKRPPTRRERAAKAVAMMLAKASA